MGRVPETQERGEPGLFHLIMHVGKWFEIHNLIKARCSSSWLTPSQQKALRTIHELTSTFGRCNLHGNVGVGKTFVAWVLSKEHGLVYFPTPNLLLDVVGTHGKFAIIDNYSERTLSYRKLAPEMSIRGFLGFILISREPIADHIHKVELTLTEADYVWVNRTLYENLGITVPLSTETRVGGLWRNIFCSGRVSVSGIKRSP